MKLYELQIRPGPRPALVTKETPQPAAFCTRYHTNGQLASKDFSDTKKALVEAGGPAALALNQVTIRTDLKAADWCQLLEADAPGPHCPKTPQDYVTARHLVKVWRTVDEGGDV